MVGTFYRASSPESKPFVEVGQSVKKGDILCIVEAMKMESTLKSPAAGTISVSADEGARVKPGVTIATIV